MKLAQELLNTLFKIFHEVGLTQRKRSSHHYEIENLLNYLRDKYNLQTPAKRNQQTNYKHLTWIGIN